MGKQWLSVTVSFSFTDEEGRPSRGILNARVKGEDAVAAKVAECEDWIRRQGYTCKGHTTKPADGPFPERNMVGH